MGQRGQDATVADIERAVIESTVRARSRASRLRMLALVVGATALVALAASALAPSPGDDGPARRDVARPGGEPARPQASQRERERERERKQRRPAPRVEAEERGPGAREEGTITVPVRKPRPSLPPP